MKKNAIKRCYLCENKTHNLGEHQEFKKSDIVICDHCSLIQTIPLPKDAPLRKYYTKKFRDERKDQKLDGKYIKQQRALAGSQFRFIKSVISRDIRGMKVLEIGCSIGILLKILEDKGANVHGVEPDEKNSDFGRKYFGLDIKTKSFDHKDYKNGEFDLVIMSHVLEHMISPLKVLKNIRSILKPEGLIFIEVPNDSENKVKFMIENKFTSSHLFFFNKRSMTDLTKKSGLKIESIISYGISISTVEEDLRKGAMFKRDGIKLRLLPFLSKSLMKKIFKKITGCHEDIYSERHFKNIEYGDDSGVGLRVVLRK